MRCFFKELHPCLHVRASSKDTACLSFQVCHPCLQIRLSPLQSTQAVLHCLEHSWHRDKKIRLASQQDVTQILVYPRDRPEKDELPLIQHTTTCSEDTQAEAVA